MPKIKLSHEQKEQLKSIVSTMPVFPRTESSGKPLQTWSIFRGTYLIKNYESMASRGYVMDKKKSINPKGMYRVPGIILRNNTEIAMKALKEDRVKEVIKAHYDDYTQYLKYVQSNGQKVEDNTKSSKKE